MFLQDVGWTGALPDVLHAISASSEDMMAADLICDGGGAPVTSKWIHFDERTYLEDSQVHTCLLAVTRFSLKLMHMLVALIAAGNATAYCEMRAPSSCKLAPWCQMSDLKADAPHMLGHFSPLEMGFVDERDLLPLGMHMSGASSMSFESALQALEHPQHTAQCDCDGGNQTLRLAPCTGRLYHKVRLADAYNLASLSSREVQIPQYIAMAEPICYSSQ